MPPDPSQVDGHVLQVYPNPRPVRNGHAWHRRALGCSQVCGGVGVTRTAALEPPRHVFPLRAGRSRSGGRLAYASATVARAPVRRAVSGSEAATLHRPAPRVPGAPKARARPRSSTCRSISACRSPISAKREGMVRGDVSRLAEVDLVPDERSRHARVRPRPHRYGRGNRPVFRVLVVSRKTP